MPDLITVTGIVATTPRHLVTSEGLPITSFRLASTQRRYDRTKSQWVDADTNWYTITGFRQLAINTIGSVNKGDRVVVTGRLRIRDWENGERTGTTIEIDADALGHDLSWGTSSFSRSVVTTNAPAEGEAATAAEEFPETIEATAAEEPVTEDALPVPF